MAKFTKVPVEIDAIRVSEVLDGASTGRFSENTLRPHETLMPQWVIDGFTNLTFGMELNALIVNTHHGQVRAERDAWLIRGVDGELYPCVPEVFEKTYRPSAPALVMKGDITPEQFADFKAKWQAEHGVERAVIKDAEPNGDLLDLAWGLIANAGNGDWGTQTEQWREAACRWRDEYHKTFPFSSEEAAAAMAEAWNTKAAREMTPESRDDRQKKMLSWSIECFGKVEATTVAQRALRLLEESIELAQAAGVPLGMIEELTGYVYSRPPGDLAQEVGGVSVTLLVLCAAAGLSADDEERREIARVLSKPPLHFASRNANKNELGFNVVNVSNVSIVDADKLRDPATTFKIEDQPPPKKTELRAAWEMVIEDFRKRFATSQNESAVLDVLKDMAERDQTGRARYGVPLTAHNGRDQLVDAYQEALDLSVYLRAAMEEDMPVDLPYSLALEVIGYLRTVINGRNTP